MLRLVVAVGVLVTVPEHVKVQPYQSGLCSCRCFFHFENTSLYSLHPSHRHRDFDSIHHNGFRAKEGEDDCGAAEEA